MFAEFENMIKNKISSLKEGPKTDISKVPQKYKIKDRVIQQLKLLSQGSFGFIWLAEDVSTKQKFALKRIVCITNDRYLLAKNQFELMIKLPKSKNLVGCYGGEVVTLKNGNVENKVFVILMEYCPNGTLFDLLSSRENKGFSEKQLLQITYSILEGLKSIHQVGSYHQDVKIENVLIGQDGAYKLCDFGSCSNRFIDFRKISKSQYGHIKEEIEAVTTPMYRPPEIVDPYMQFELSYKVDLWMLGCVLYTLAYFTHPFVDSNAIGIAGGVYRFPKYPQQTKYQVSDKINDFIRNLLTPNPAFRTSVQQALDIINNWYTVSQIPMNIQAQRRKNQQLIKQKELEKLNRKVVDFDGDIPMDKLIQLQQKMKKKDTVQESKPVSFITSKDQKQIKEGKTTSTFSVPTSGENIFNFGQQQPQSKEQTQKQKQQIISSNSFWTTGTSNAWGVDVKKQNSKEMDVNFDAFSDFLGKSKSTDKAQKSSTDMYELFFEKEDIKRQKSDSLVKNETNSPVKKEKEANLLDL